MGGVGCKGHVLPFNEVFCARNMEDETDRKRIVKCAKTFYVMYDEPSFTKRFDRDRSGAGQRELVECVSVVTKNALQLRDEPRKHFPGTCRLNHLGPVPLPDLQSPKVWQMKMKTKRAMLGALCMVDVGGTVPGVSGRGGRTDEDMEPVAWHGNSGKFWSEIMHIFTPEGVVDCTVLDPVLAYECVKNHVLYTGIAFSEEHATCLMMRLEEQLYHDLFMEESDVFNSAAAADKHRLGTSTVMDDDSDAVVLTKATAKRSATPAVKGEPRAEEHQSEPAAGAGQPTATPKGKGKPKTKAKAAAEGSDGGLAALAAELQSLVTESTEGEHADGTFA